MCAQAGGGKFAAPAGIVLTVGWAVLWTLAAIGAGEPVRRWLDAGAAAGWEDRIVGAAAGSGVLVACAAALSVLGLFRPWPLIGVVLLWAVPGASIVIRRRRDCPALPRMGLPLVGMAGVALLVAATMSPFYDQWHQHLGFPWVWLLEGSVQVLPRNWYSYMPVNSSLLFAYGLGTLGIWSAQVVHWWCGLLTVLAVAAIAHRMGGRPAAVGAAWILATTPTLLHLATTAGSDLVITLFTAAAWVGLLRAGEERASPTRWWVFAGACVGLAVGTKYSAIGTVAIPAAVGAVVLGRPWRGMGELAWFARRAAIATATALAVFAPWAIRNWVATGNPLFPFANGLFRQSLRVPYEEAARFAAWLSGFDTSPRHLWQGLDLGAFRWSIDGFPSTGLAYLGLAAAAAVMWQRLARPLATALAVAALTGAAFWMASQHANRYLLPVLLPAAAVLGAALAEILVDMPRRVRLGIVALLGLALSWNLAASVSQLGVERLGCTLGATSPEPILARWVSSSPSFAAVAELPEDARVLLVAESRALGFERRVELEHPFGEPRLLELARRSSHHREMGAALARDGLTHVLANSWEAARIARMRGRQRYFEPPSDAVASRLDRFARECLAPVWSGAGLGLYRLVPDCSAPPPGAGDLASW